LTFFEALINNIFFFGFGDVINSAVIIYIALGWSIVIILGYGIITTLGYSNNNQ